MNGFVSCTEKNYIYCCVPSSPCLSKTGLILARIFNFNGLSVCIRLVRTLRMSWRLLTSVRTSPPIDRLKGLTARVSSRPGAKAVLRRPRPAGTQQYVCTCAQTEIFMNVWIS